MISLVQLLNEIEGKTKIIERLIRTEDDLQTSYEVKTVPLP